VSFDYTHVPQANRPELVLRISEMTTTGSLTIYDIHSVLSAAGRGEFVERQALYYARAAELFGLVESDGSSFVATELATRIHASTNRQERKQLLKAAALSNPLIVKIVEHFSQQRPTREQISQFLTENTTLADSTSQRRASSVLVFMNQWLYGETGDPVNLNSREWVTLKDFSGNPLPEWAQFFLDLGRLSALESETGVIKWRLVTVPHRNFAASLFAVGYLEAKIPAVLASIDEFDITDLVSGDQITWKRTDGELVFGHFLQVNEPNEKRGHTFSHSRMMAKGLEPPQQRVISKAREFRFAQYFGDPFVNPRQMSRNRLFFQSFAGELHEDLLCNSLSVVCLAGRPELRNDLTSNEFKIGKHEGSLDDLLRVRGINDANEVAHFLTDYISPAADISEVRASMCAVFDGHHEYPKLKSYISAEDNLVVLDRWETSSTSSVNAFDLERATKGQRAKYRPTGLTLPPGIEYMEWSESK
jgi:hypothetical protein